MKRVALLSVVIFLNLISTRNAMAAATLTTLHVFRGNNGNAPVAPLALGTNGNLYGTTEFGGTATNTACIGGCGTVFEVSPDGAFTRSTRSPIPTARGPALGCCKPATAIYTARPPSTDRSAVWERCSGSRRTALSPTCTPSVVSMASIRKQR